LPWFLVNSSRPMSRVVPLTIWMLSPWTVLPPLLLLLLLVLVLESPSSTSTSRSKSRSRTPNTQHPTPDPFMIVNKPATQPPAADLSGADARRERAPRTVRDAAFEALLASSEPQRTTDLSRAVAERLGLATDENSLGAVAPLVRMVLDSDAAFVHTARQW